MHPKVSALGGAASCAALLLPLAACSENEPEATTHTDEQLAAIALASTMSDINQTQAVCTGKALVDDLGVSGLKKALILNDDLVASLNRKYDHTTATAIAAASIGCWDWEERAMGIARAYPKATDTQWATYLACTQQLDDELEMFIYSRYYTDGKPSEQLAFTASEEVCREAIEPKGKKNRN